MSVERWIFHEGLRPGNAVTFENYLDILPERMLQIMTRAELTLFYNVLVQMGGYIAVQSKKRWQQVVKNCNFAQTTSSSYSTRNKYESYLLAKEIHDYLWAAMGRSNDLSVSKGLLHLAEICLCHYEQVEAASSKKNLLEPLQEMFEHGPEALKAVVDRIVIPDSDEELGYVLLILRCMTSKRLQHFLKEAFSRTPAVGPALVAFVHQNFDDPSKADDVVLVGILLAISLYDSEPGANSEEICRLFDRLISSHLQDSYLGRTLTHRLSHCPGWVLQGLNLKSLIMASRTALELSPVTDYMLLPRGLLRLLSSTVSVANPSASHGETNWEEVFGFFVPFAKEGSGIESTARSVLVAFAKFQPIFNTWICQQLQVASMAEVEPDDEDDSSEDRKNMEGKRRIMSSVGLSRKKLKGEEEPKRPARRGRGRGGADEEGQDSSAVAVVAAGAGGSPDAAEDFDPNDDDAKRAKREKERVRRSRIKQEREERFRGAGNAGGRGGAGTARSRKVALKSDEATVAGALRGKRGRRPAENATGGRDAALQGGGRAREIEFEAERLKLEMRILALEAQVTDRDIILANKDRNLFTMQGFMRFWNGEAETYSSKECDLVRSHAEVVLKRISARTKLAMDVPQPSCVVCRANAATVHPPFCMCLAYCEDCIPSTCLGCGCGAKMN